IGCTTMGHHLSHQFPLHFPGADRGIRVSQIRAANDGLVEFVFDPGLGAGTGVFGDFYGEAEMDVNRNVNPPTLRLLRTRS
ncbi:MAG TPA: hypothetical protein VK666_22095, partial [Chryseolinea sp.]|nr:hypothetical protein [Chryseolinea sp.]